MTYRNESAWIQPAAPAAAPRATQARSTAEYRALDAAHHIHPFSDMGALNRAGSRVIVKADGVYLWDSDGNKVIDGMAGLWCVNVGYGRKEL
ncbi:MAG: aminotransferase class III-fold pyridoxal phosphate-dependent enzyme, partial [Burkholderia sp.]|nr:aminotransferase class III-fold pyridoxal phosphate-dependent enzyme [Burkholderia sp.]MCA3821381.1 aminotransferase class III-fold pyridoxal phosphate-dependent enzyme [Burkholderia sp.]